MNNDSDGDGILDRDEVINGTSPINADTMMANQMVQKWQQELIH